MQAARLFLPTTPVSWPEPLEAPSWQRWLLGDSLWHLPENHPAQAQPEYWVLCHPARFEADLACLRLTGVQQDPMGSDLQERLMAILKTTMAGHIAQLDALPAVLAMELKHPDPVTFSPLGEVLGQDLQHCLPRGENALFWSKYINELQMHCHQQGLQQQGINGLWFSRPTPVPEALPRPEHIAGGGPAADWARVLACPYTADETLAPGGWLWLEQPPDWPVCSGGLRGRWSRWRGRCISVHAGLSRCWPDRLLRP